jgi:integrase
LPPREYLPDEDVRRLIGAAFEVDDDFGRLVLLLAATGARFSQVARMVIGDVIGGESPHVMVPPSRKGRPGSHAPTAIKVQVGLDVVDALRPAMAGRPGHEPLLLRWHHVQEKGDPAIGTKPHWRQAARVKWRVAADMTRRWDEAVLIAGLPSTMTPYRLRDAAIIRMLREGMPLELVANLANTSEKMIRRSYARHIHDALDDLARKAVVPLAPIQVTKLKVVGE